MRRHPTDGEASTRIDAAGKMTGRPLYSEFAEHYDALFGGVDSACLDFVQARVPPPAILLDAGCGTGQYAAAFASRGYNVAAVDREPDLIKARPAHSVGVGFIVADLQWLPFLTRFQAILARGVLNDLVEADTLAGVLRSLAASLTDDGCLIADVRERDVQHRRVAEQPVVERKAGRVTFRAQRNMGKDHTVASREKFAVNGKWSRPFEFKMRIFTEEEVRDLWREAGLEVLTVERSYGGGSRLAGRLIVVAGRMKPS
jgi:SAM-dependent methyltransferase